MHIAILEYSGGEKSRTVFARGIIMKPQIILAAGTKAALQTGKAALVSSSVRITGMQQICAKNIESVKPEMMAS